MNLQEFLDENLYDNKKQVLDEDVKSFINNLKAKIKKIYKISNVRAHKIKDKFFFVFKKGIETSFILSNGKKFMTMREYKKNGAAITSVVYNSRIKLNESSFMEDLSKNIPFLTEDRENLMKFKNTQDEIFDDDDKNRESGMAIRSTVPLLRKAKLPDKGINPSYEDGTVNLQHVENLLGNLYVQLLFRNSVKDPVPSILLFGFPGTAKTAIGSQFAKKVSSNFRSLEVKAIYDEAFGGFPTTIEEEKKDNKKGKKSKKSLLLKYAEDPKTFDISSLSLKDQLLFDLESIIACRNLSGGFNKSLNKKLKANIKNFKNLGYSITIDDQSLSETSERGSRIFEDTTGSKKKVRVKLLPVEGLLPPSDSKQGWVLLFDEVTRGKSSSKMSTVMNLMYVGAIGTTYFLPLKTIVMGTSNLGEEDGEDDVNRVTGAMLTRFNYFVRITTNFGATIAYQRKQIARRGEENLTNKSYDSGDGDQPDVVNDSDEEKEIVRLYRTLHYPSVFINYIYRRIAEIEKNKGYAGDDEILKFGNKEYPELTIYQSSDDDDAGNTVLLNARALETIVQNVFTEMAKDWVLDNIVGKHSKDFYENEFKEGKVFSVYDPVKKSFVKEKAKSALAVYADYQILNKRYLPIIASSLGKNAKDIILDMIASVQETLKENKIGSPSEIITELMYRYYVTAKNKKERHEIKKASMDFGSLSSFGNEIIIELHNIGSIANLKKELKQKKIDITKIIFPGEKEPFFKDKDDEDYYVYVAENIKLFIDLVGSSDYLGRFVVEFEDYFEESEDKNSKAYKFITTIYNTLRDDSEWEEAIAKAEKVHRGNNRKGKQEDDED